MSDQRGCRQLRSTPTRIEHCGDFFMSQDNWLKEERLGQPASRIALVARWTAIAVLIAVVSGVEAVDLDPNPLVLSPIEAHTLKGSPSGARRG